MAKKAKLDILEITPDESEEKPGQDEGTAEEGGDGGSIEDKTGGNYLSRAMGWVRKPLFWIILIVVVLLSSSVGILIVYYQYYQSADENTHAVQKKQAVSVAPVKEVKRGAVFEDMVVDQKDEYGNIRIVFCDVALDLENHKAASAIGGDRVDVRNMIYTVLKKEGAEEGLSLEGRGRVKEKLKNELNSFFGENLVKNVYFTRYELN
jgi:flagellar basal body-associated protein FliL